MMQPTSLLSDEQGRELRGLLEEQREHLERLLLELRAQAQPIGLDLPIGRLSRMDALQQQQMAAGQQRRLEQELQQVIAALDRMDRQRYGLCLRCSESIPFGRLIIRPTTPLCYQCQSERETKQGRS